MHEHDGHDYDHDDDYVHDDDHDDDDDHDHDYHDYHDYDHDYHDYDHDLDDDLSPVWNMQSWLGPHHIEIGTKLDTVLLTNNLSTKNKNKLLNIMNLK